MHTKQVVTAGKPLSEAASAIIMIHGRGADASGILSMAEYLPVQEFAQLAPQATNHTWYPYSFMAPVEENEPWLSSAIQVLDEVVIDIVSAGIKKENLYFLGFSQGACLTLEYTARRANRYGGVIAFTGGLIGADIDTSNYGGDFNQTPIFIGSSDPDPHVPASRVLASAAILRSMNAAVTDKIYKGMGHTISEDEIEQVKKLMFK
ncbi:alpha/beta hydrolase [Pseudoflavitalea rhizosphaerae]|uniref:alpha/beta hydrolase n=1 Tax=Pseudoflavitalea rhizosphaerae TaxID=1884793 RepID=UPI000F8D7D29|nr:dienelactone hydrolase family protein [Pseudoflavitalea rhizosphaerae]